MKIMSRRQFLFVVSSMALTAPCGTAAASPGKDRLKRRSGFPITSAVLQEGYKAETSAHKHYEGYCREAIKAKYPNIAYLFRAFSESEKIQAANYKKILLGIMDSPLEEPVFDVLISDTKANLGLAARKELEKIEETYPGFLNRLRIESHDQAVVSCMYAWKSHKQHEEKISEIRRYSTFFFGAVAEKIEDLKLDFHVCGICGATVDEAPETPCDICNHPVSHYHEVKRPA